MSNSQEARYFVIRYMVGDTRDEAVNIGVVAVDESRRQFALRFLDDPTTKARVDAPFDLKAVSMYRQHLETLVFDARTGTSDNWFQRFNSSLAESGNLIRARGPYTVLTENMDEEAKQLFDEWVAPSKVATKKPQGPRDPLGGLRREAHTAITRQIRETLPPQIRRDNYKPRHEVRGQKHTSVFDAAIVMKRRTHSVEHLFHHVLLMPDAEESFNQAASLLWKWNDVQERNGKDRDLTAVLFSRGGVKREGVEEAKSILKKDKVRVAEVRQVPGIVRDVGPQLRLPIS